MEEFKIGDLVTYPLNDTLYFGTIISIDKTNCLVDNCSKMIKVKDLGPGELPFKVGDFVIIRNDLKVGTRYGRISFGEGMNGLKGHPAKVTKISKTGTYYLDTCDWTFSKEMLLPSINIGDLVILKAPAYSKFPAFRGNIYKIEEISDDGSICNIQGVEVPISDLEKVQDHKEETTFRTLYIGDNKFELSSKDQKEIFDLNNLENENQLQRKDPVVIRGKCPEGSRVYGRRPKATISVRPLSNKTRIGFSQG